MHESFQLFTDIFFTVAIFLNAAFFIPQIILLLRTKRSEGLSIPMFLGFNFIQLAIALHGYTVKDYILMWGYVLSFITCGTVVILIIIYRE